MGLLFSVILSIVCVGSFARTEGGANIIWLANGLILAFLLLVPRWRWTMYISVGFIGLIVGSLLIAEPLSLTFLFNCLNTLEILIGAMLMKRRSADLPNFTDRRYLLRFIGFACLLGPAVSGVLYGIFRHVQYHEDFQVVLLEWAIGDGLGIAVVTPTFVAILKNRMRNTHLLRRRWIYPLLVVLVTVLVFSQNRLPLLFLVFPFLILVVTQIDLGWAALSTLVVAILGGWYTVPWPWAFVSIEKCKHRVEGRDLSAFSRIGHVQASTSSQWFSPICASSRTN